MISFENYYRYRYTNIITINHKRVVIMRIRSQWIIGCFGISCLLFGLACTDEQTASNEDDGNRGNDTGSFVHLLVINEIQNKTDDDQPDWIELFVKGEQSIVLDGYSLIDENDEHTPYMLPNITLQPGEFFYIEKGELPNGFDFGLGKNDCVKLLYNDVVVHELVWSDEQTRDGASFGLYPDGEGMTQALDPTPNGGNRLPTL